DRRADLRGAAGRSLRRGAFLTAARRAVIFPTTRRATARGGDVNRAPDRAGMNYRWTLRPTENEAAVAEIARDLNGLPEALARALVLRGVGSFEGARGFFRPSLEAAHDPFLMRDMDPAADRLARAVEKKERVMVYGDYDVDGTTSAAM